MCKGAHEAWNNRCLVRKVELSKVKAAYNTRQPYYFVPLTKERPLMGRAVIDITLAEAAAMINGTQRGRPSATIARPLPLAPTLPQSRQNSRSKSLTKGGAPKRVHLGNGLDSTQDENEDTIMVEDSCHDRGSGGRVEGLYSSLWSKWIYKTFLKGEKRFQRANFLIRSCSGRTINRDPASKPVPHQNTRNRTKTRLNPSISIINILTYNTFINK
jgi:hypothetical protein